MGWHEVAGLFEGQAQEAIQSAWEAPEAVTHALKDITLLAPVDHQEVWAAGVTYLRSKTPHGRIGLQRFGLRPGV